LGICAAFALLTVACSRTPKVQTPKPTPVRVAVAVTGPAHAPITATGNIGNKDEMRLSFKVSGVIRRIAVQPGQRVLKGQLLAELDLTEIKAQVAQAKQVAEKAARDLARGERLYKDRVIALEQLQDLRTQSSVANAQLDVARFNQGYSSIVAPQDGSVLRKLAAEGEFAVTGQPILVLGGRDQGFVLRAGLADREVVRVHIEDPATIELDAFPGQTLPGMVSEIGSAADERGGLFPVEIELASTRLSLVSGLVAHVSIESSEPDGAAVIYVPIAAILEGDRDRASVFVVANDVAIHRAVRTAFIHADRVAIAEGLREGERVVTDGALYLQDGEHVEIQPPTTAQTDGTRESRR
jgi:RND family efflux transporter MFP subunit